MPQRGPPPSTAQSVHHAELLTPDAILRQRQSARISAPASTAPTPAATDHSVQSGGSGNLDIFNALMTDFGAEMGGGPADDGLSPFDYLDFSPHVFPHGADQHSSYL